MGHCRKTQISIFLTTKCNLNCKYCYANSKEKFSIPQTIDINFAKRGITDFFEKFPSREIRFFSVGEPTVAFSEMKIIHDWVLNTTNGDCRFELQTNGYFSQHVADWIAKNIDIVWVSCDGPPEIQNHYRLGLGGRPSSDIVEKNIRFLSSKPLFIGCRSTIGQANIYKQNEIIEYFSKMGIKAIMSDPIFATVSSENQTENINLIDYAKNFLKARKLAESKGIFYGSILTINFDEKVEYFCRSCIPYPHLTTDGYVTCCDMAYTGSDSRMEKLVYGKYNEDKDVINYDLEKIDIIKSRKTSNLFNCQNCSILDNCAGACIGEALNETGSIFGIKPEVCNAIRYLAKRMPLNSGVYPYLHP